MYQKLPFKKDLVVNKKYCKSTISMIKCVRSVEGVCKNHMQTRLQMIMGE